MRRTWSLKRYISSLWQILISLIIFSGLSAHWWIFSFVISFHLSCQFTHITKFLNIETSYHSGIFIILMNFHFCDKFSSQCSIFIKRKDSNYIDEFLFVSQWYIFIRLIKFNHIYEILSNQSIFITVMNFITLKNFHYINEFLSNGESFSFIFLTS